MSNHRHKFSFEYDLADLPMLADALMIATTSAMMNHRFGAQKRLRDLTEAIRPIIPAAANIFDRNVFYELCAALNDGDPWTLAIKPALHKWETNGYLIVNVGNRQFRSNDWNHKIDDQIVLDLHNLLEEMSPLATSSPP